MKEPKTKTQKAIADIRKRVKCWDDNAEDFKKLFEDDDMKKYYDAYELNEEIKCLLNRVDNSISVNSIKQKIAKYKKYLKNWQNEEYRKKVSTGRKEMWKLASPDCKKKMLANLSKPSRPRGKQVQCIETNIIYPSTREAERLTGINHCNISQVCTGKRKTAGKFHWRYVEE